SGIVARGPPVKLLPVQRAQFAVDQLGQEQRVARAVGDCLIGAEMCAYNRGAQRNSRPGGERETGRSSGPSGDQTALVQTGATKSPEDPGWITRLGDGLVVGPLQAAAAIWTTWEAIGVGPGGWPRAKPPAARRFEPLISLSGGKSG